SLRHGLEFVQNAMECLRPGGIAVHTTEFNCSSDDRTLESGETVLYRRSDLTGLAATMRATGHALDLKFAQGELPADRVIDLFPYSADGHLKLRLGEHVITSIGIIIKKSPAPPNLWTQVVRRRRQI